MVQNPVYHSISHFAIKIIKNRDLLNCFHSLRLSRLLAPHRRFLNHKRLSIWQIATATMLFSQTFLNGILPLTPQFLESNIQFRFLITFSQWYENTEASSADLRMGRWPLWPWEPGELTVHMRCLRFVSARPDPRSPVKVLREAFFSFLFLLSRAGRFRSVGRSTGRQLYRTPHLHPGLMPRLAINDIILFRTTYHFKFSILNYFSSMTVRD